MEIPIKRRNVKFIIFIFHELTNTYSPSKCWQYKKHPSGNSFFWTVRKQFGSDVSDLMVLALAGAAKYFALPHSLHCCFFPAHSCLPDHSDHLCLSSMHLPVLLCSFPIPGTFEVIAHIACGLMAKLRANSSLMQENSAERLMVLNGEVFLSDALLLWRALIW